MKKYFSNGIALALFFFTGFRGVEKTAKTIKNEGIPKEKKAFE